MVKSPYEEEPGVDSQAAEVERQQDTEEEPLRGEDPHAVTGVRGGKTRGGLLLMQHPPISVISHA